MARATDQQGTNSDAGAPVIYAPIKGSPSMSTNTGYYGGAFGAGRPGGRKHMGGDVACPMRTPCVAPVDGKVTKWGWGGDLGGMIHFTPNEDVGALKAGQIIGWGHCSEMIAKPGSSVTGGQIIAYSGTYGSGPHVHFIYRPDGDDADDGSADPAPIYNALKQGKQPTGEANGGGASGGGGGGGADLGVAEQNAKATAFATFLQLPGILDTTESYALAGERSLMNDQPLLPFIEQLATASLRHFQSMPNGNFFAFYPDYFGGLNHRTPYWEIQDIEIIDGVIHLNDDALATHVYTVGDVSAFDGQITLEDKIQSSGVVTVFNAFLADFLNGLPEAPPKDEKSDAKDKREEAYIEAGKDLPTLRNKDRAIAFVKKYGARPYFEEAPMVRSPYYEAFLAYQRFCLLWSRQFIAEFTTTFMPELFPGGIVTFPNHGLQCYIDEVEHRCSYTDGFTTHVNLSAPSSSPGTSRVFKEGMIRSSIQATSTGNSGSGGSE
jgi:hypothetical protein